MSAAKLQNTYVRPEHGGQLNAMARKFSIPLNECIDLSTGINPNGWSVPSIPADVFLRLPEQDDALVSSAEKYYQAKNLLPVAGSQAAIQCLPMLRSTSRVGVVDPSYQEHAYCWNKAGHNVQFLAVEDIDTVIDQLDVLIIINPNNPTGKIFSTEQLIDWHAKLSNKNGWLIIDEAFMDAAKSHSLLQYSQQPGLIVLRSLGKFFGLAGLRVGFVFAELSLLTEIEKYLGPWTISNPSRYIANKALLDEQWQLETRQKLDKQAKRLADLLIEYDLQPNGGTELFHWVFHDKAFQLYEFLATHGIVVRYFEATNSLRFGLPKDEFQWQRLGSILFKMSKIFGKRYRQFNT